MKKNCTTFTIVLSMLLLFTLNATAQESNKSSKKEKDTKVRMEEVKEKCKDLPLDKRIRLTVARFNSTAANSPKELGQNMSTMLSSALSQVNCFNVLEEKKNMDDLTGEIDIANSEYSDAGSGVEKGKMLVAQIVVTGEITEFNEEKNATQSFGFSSSKTKVHMGFVLKVTNPRTREVLKATSFNVDSKTGTGSGFSIFGVKTSGSSSSNPAIASALEQGVIDAVEYLASEKDKIPLPSAEDANLTLTMVTINNVSFSNKNAVLEMIKATAGVKDANVKSYANNVAIIVTRHNGSSDDLATVLDKKSNGKYSIEEVSSGKIVLQMR